jgi:hypothetical protein
MNMDAANNASISVLSNPSTLSHSKYTCLITYVLPIPSLDTLWIHWIAMEGLPWGDKSRGLLDGNKLRVRKSRAGLQMFCLSIRLIEGGNWWCASGIGSDTIAIGIWSRYQNSEINIHSYLVTQITEEPNLNGHTLIRQQPTGRHCSTRFSLVINA